MFEINDKEFFSIYDNIPAKHPLRKLRHNVEEALQKMLLNNKELFTDDFKQLTYIKREIILKEQEIGDGKELNLTEVNEFLDNSIANLFPIFKMKMSERLFKTNRAQYCKWYRQCFKDFVEGKKVPNCELITEHEDGVTMFHNKQIFLRFPDGMIYKEDYFEDIK